MTKLLLHLHDPPPILYSAGSMALLDKPVVAIVGTRRATAYGERVARQLGSTYGRAGATVMSGMAVGIDAAAHRGAMEANGATAAVLGTGIDVAYPASHRGLHARIARDGLLLSEFQPGDKASAGSFPRRNRIIAALAKLTIVVEAPERSGALITADHALSLGRTVAAVPGALDSPQSAGSNALLRDGASFIGSMAEALSLAGLESQPTLREPELDPDQRAVWHALGAGALALEALASRASLPARRAMVAITTLELAGLVECELTGVVRRR
jgi:DNA processing protein